MNTTSRSWLPKGKDGNDRHNYDGCDGRSICNRLGSGLGGRVHPWGRDQGNLEMKPAWHGGNKIPLSYLAKFSPKPKDGVPDDLRRFLDLNFTETK